jgi:Domain of unknown function DUF11
MRRLSLIVLSFLLLAAVAAAPAAAQTTGGLVVELRQVTAAHEQSLVAYEVVIRNEGTERAGFGRLLLDVPNDFAWALQYDPVACLRYPSEDIDCSVEDLDPGQQVVYTFEYVVQAPPGDYQVMAWYTIYGSPPTTITSSVTTSVGPSAQLQVAWSQFRSGANVVRRATVSAFGPSTATGVALALTWQGGRGMPGPVSVTPSQGTCDPPTATSTRCALGELSPFATTTVDLAFRLRGPRGLTTTAEVTSLTFDPDPSDNTATLST